MKCVTVSTSADRVGRTNRLEDSIRTQKQSRGRGKGTKKLSKRTWSKNGQGDNQDFKKGLTKGEVK